MSDWLWKDDEKYEAYLWNDAGMYQPNEDTAQNRLLLELNKNLHALTRIIAEANGYTSERKDT